MGNCLVKKLKGVVDNNNLEVFGQMKFQYNRPSGNTNKLAISTTGTCHILIKHGATVDYDAYLINTTYQFDPVSETLYDVTIDGKYVLTQIGSTSGILIETEKFDFPAVFTTINLSYSDSTGKVEDFAKCLSVENINITSCPNIGGSVADLAVAMFNSGRHSGTLHYQGTGTTVAQGIAGRNIYITFGADSISVSTDSEGQTVVATYANGQWSYPNP